MPENGYNPLRWDCEKRGCFNVYKRPKIELFSGCLPGKIAFTDIDGIVEISGQFLLLEWKDHAEVSTGQRILFERITAGPFVVLVILGNAETMDVQGVQVVKRGEFQDFMPCDLAILKELIGKWAQYAVRHPKCAKHSPSNPASRR